MASSSKDCTDIDLEGYNMGTDADGDGAVEVVEVEEEAEVNPVVEFAVVS